MRPTRVVVTGAGGQVGRDLVDLLARAPVPGEDVHFQPDARPVGRDEFTVVALTHQDLDVRDRDQVVAAIASSTPDVVVHLGAYTAVDRAERDVATCLAVNADGTGYLSDACAATGAHLIAVSTDYVFDGQSSRAYVETDAPHPRSVYGISKWLGERRCRPSDTVVRTSWVMGVRGHSVVHVIAQRARAGQPVRFVDDQCGTVTVAADLARALVTLVRERPGGLWHVANAGSLTWFELARFVGGWFGRDDGFATAITTGELEPPPLAPRPTRSDLDTGKWRARWAGLPPWTEGVGRLLSAWAAVTP